MKKYMAVFIVCLSLAFNTVYAFAADSSYSLFKTTYGTSQDIDEIKNFKITGGLNGETETTFDSVRTITGQAPKGTVVEIEVYKMKNDGKSFSKSYAEKPITVGASGVFSESIDLSLGDNYVLVTATYGDSVEVTSAKITRKDVEIKKELEKGIVLPG